MKNYYDEGLLLLQASNILPLSEKKKIPTSCPMWHVKMGTQAGRPDADEGQSNWEQWFGICPNPVHNWSQNDCKIQENGGSFTSVSASEV